ncbi:zinc metalloprotease [Amycolatopsis sp. cg5]|uniref:zinc metalloprotease n=1 Tax=Amycolatopsis sp. cg5 TaxID=3238802 RepID=UPI00352668E7
MSRRIGRLTAVSALALACLVAPGSAAVATACAGENTSTGGAFADGGELSPAKAEAAQRKLKTGTPRIGQVSIPVHFHVISDGAKGAVSIQRLSKQVDVLNQTFSGTGFAFTAASATSYDRADLFYDQSLTSPPGAREIAMKKAMRKGGVRDLNIYTVQTDESALGWATFPWDYKENPQLDGVILNHDVLPGGAFVGLSTGKIGTHEVGHWLGLLHTFQGVGCEPPGDYVDDTPAQDTASRGGCPTSQDSCPSPGDDPIHNHMDYTNDLCRTMFTPGQVTRMQQAWNAFRA